jgi:hypothetical protein
MLINTLTNMTRLRNRVSLVLGLCLQLTAFWLALAPGLVLCLEQNGQMAIEVSTSEGRCGTSEFSSDGGAHGPILTALADTHCDGCQDVRLDIADSMSATNQRLSIESSPLLSMLPGHMAAPLTHHFVVPATPLRALRIAAVRSTILRI